MYTGQFSFIHASKNGRFHCFYFLDIVNGTVINTEGTDVSATVLLISLGISGPYSSSSFIREGHTVFHNDCPNSHFHQQCARVQFFLHPCQLLFCFMYLSLEWGIISLCVVLICISQMMNDGSASFFVPISHLYTHPQEVSIWSCYHLKLKWFEFLLLSSLSFYVFWVVDLSGSLCRSTSLGLAGSARIPEASSRHHLVGEAPWGFAAAFFGSPSSMSGQLTKEPCKLCTEEPSLDPHTKNHGKHLLLFSPLDKRKWHKTRPWGKESKSSNLLFPSPRSTTFLYHLQGQSDHSSER